MSPRSRRQRGFTLVELMIVISIIGVLASLAFVYLDPNLEPRDLAASTANLAREAGRRAAAGGPVRSDVATALNINYRTRLRVTSGLSQDRHIVVERLQEDPSPAVTANWIQVGDVTIPSSVALVGWRPTADLNGGVGPSVTLAPADEVELHCVASGRCDAATFYFQLPGNDASLRARVAILPLGGAPAEFNSW